MNIQRMSNASVVEATGGIDMCTYVECVFLKYLRSREHPKKERLYLVLDTLCPITGRRLRIGLLRTTWNWFTRRLMLPGSTGSNATSPLCAGSRCPASTIPTTRRR